MPVIEGKHMKYPVEMLAAWIHFLMQLTLLIKAVSTQGACHF